MVVVAGTTELPVNTRLIATVHRPDGSSAKVVAYKDRLLRRTPIMGGVEGFLLVGLERIDIPEGSSLDVPSP
jgi:hypothetical protein